jgi:hypothetical protein
VRAYGNFRQKFIVDKLFSPVLKSQSSTGNGFELGSASEVPIMESPFPQEIVIQGGLRARVTRTADGNPRPRAYKPIDYRQEPDLLPQIDSVKRITEPAS